MVLHARHGTQRSRTTPRSLAGRRKRQVRWQGNEKRGLSDDWDYSSRAVVRCPHPVLSVASRTAQRKLRMMSALPLHPRIVKPARRLIRPVVSATQRRRPQPRRNWGLIKSRLAKTVDGASDPQREHGHWHTVGIVRMVLVAVHTITSLIRLEDIVILLESDPRIQLVYTQVPDRFNEGVEKRLREMEVRVIPWEEAINRTFDLVV